MKKLSAFVTTFVLALAVLGAVPVQASAAPVKTGATTKTTYKDERPCRFCTKYHVVSLKTKKNHVDKRKALATCSVGKRGGSCRIRTQRSVKTEVNVTFGVSQSVVSSALNITDMRSKTVSISCAHTFKKAGTWRAWARGSWHTYKIQKSVWTASGVKRTVSPKTVTAFVPYRDSVACG